MQEDLSNRDYMGKVFNIKKVERDVIKDSPVALIVGNIGAALRDIDNPEVKERALQNITSPLLWGRSDLPEVTKKFVNYVELGEKEHASFFEGKEREYLAIILGFAETLKQLQETSPSVAQSLLDSFIQMAEKDIRQNPSANAGLDVLNIIKERAKLS